MPDVPFKAKVCNKGKKGYFIRIKGSFHQENKIVLN